MSLRENSTLEVPMNGISELFEKIKPVVYSMEWEQLLPQNSTIPVKTAAMCFFNHL
jgi:hypothetical protein